MKYRCSIRRAVHISFELVRSRCFHRGNVHGDVLSVGNTSPIVHKASRVLLGWRSMIGSPTPGNFSFFSGSYTRAAFAGTCFYYIEYLMRRTVPENLIKETPARKSTVSTTVSFVFFLLFYFLFFFFLSSSPVPFISSACSLPRHSFRELKRTRAVRFAEQRRIPRGPRTQRRFFVSGKLFDASILNFVHTIMRILPSCGNFSNEVQ